MIIFLARGGRLAIFTRRDKPGSDSRSPLRSPMSASGEGMKSEKLIFKIDGPAGSSFGPRSLRPSQLLELLEQFEEALLGVNPDMLEVMENRAFVSLDRITKGSIAVHNDATPRALAANDFIAADLDETGGENLPLATREAIRNLSSECRARGLTFSAGRQHEELRWVVTKETELAKPKRVAQQLTSEYGEIASLHLINNTAKLSVRKRQVALEALTDEQIQYITSALSENAKQTFRVEGLAAYSLKSRRLGSMKVDKITKVKRPDGEFLTRLKKLTGGIDADSFIEYDKAGP